MTQPEALFDPRSTERPVCSACGAKAKNLCVHDGDIAHGLIERLTKRPEGCIAHPQVGPDDPWPDNLF